MKFRVLFIIFNVVIIASFVLIFLMPALVLGWEYTRIFWTSNWPVGAVFVVVLAVLNAYFVRNWSVFRLLEEERWNDLIVYLEREIVERNRVSVQRARILVNAYVVTGHVAKIGELETSIRDRRPRIIAKLAIEFGVPYLLGGDAQAMGEYFGAMKENPRAASPLWVRWCYAFALLSRNEYDHAKGELVAVLETSRDPLLRALSAHMLEPFGTHDEAVASLVRDQRSALRSRYTRESLDRELEKQKQNLQVLFLSARIEEARDWVYSG